MAADIPNAFVQTDIGKKNNGTMKKELRSFKSLNLEIMLATVSCCYQSLMTSVFAL
jgi:hypothetical protein